MMQKEYPRVNIKLEGKQAAWTLAGMPFYPFDAVKQQEDGVTEYISHCPKFRVESRSARFGGSVRIENTVVNDGELPLKLIQVSSLLISGLNRGGSRPWWDKERFLVHFCRSAWQGEMQWQTAVLTELGVYPASNHANTSAAVFASVGSMSTSQFYPLILIEDLELGCIHYFELEGAHSYRFEIGVRTEEEGELLYLEGNSAFFHQDGFRKTLEPGGRFVAARGVYGTVKGGFQEAVRALTEYKRRTSPARFAEKPPVVFNEYMNCIWTDPTKQNLLPNIDAAAEAGAEIYCIDAGWYQTPGSREQCCGDWEWCDARFGRDGFLGILDYIRQKGMLPGVWLEVENCGARSRAYREMRDCLLRRNGEILGGERAFFDFSLEKTRRYMMGVIDRLYAAGVRYIKNDYNQTIGFGADGGEYPGEKLRASIHGFYQFIDAVRLKYPALILENCSSGAMRADHETLRRFSLQSISDQECCFLNPSIVSGSHACYPPEKAGIWAYPYPMPWEERHGICEAYLSAVSARFQDGEETVFNMVCGMFGVMYLSGRIEFADRFNKSLICEAVETYKSIRRYIPEAVPCFFPKPFGIEEEGIFALGLYHAQSRTLLLGVFRIGGDEREKEYDLSAYTDEDASACLLYPVKNETQYTWKDGRLAVVPDAEHCARLFRVRPGQGR